MISFSRYKFPPIPGTIDFDADRKTDIPSTVRQRSMVYQPSGGGGTYGVGFEEMPPIIRCRGLWWRWKKHIAIYRYSTGACFINPSGAVRFMEWLWRNVSDIRCPLTMMEMEEWYSSLSNKYRGLFIYPSGGGSIYGIGFGETPPISRSRDYDGDGTADLAIYARHWCVVYLSLLDRTFRNLWGRLRRWRLDIRSGRLWCDGKTDIASIGNDRSLFIYPSLAGARVSMGCFGGDVTDKPVLGIMMETRRQILRSIVQL